MNGYSDKNSASVADRVEQIAADTIAAKNLPLELVDVEYVKERDWYLRIFIDKDGGVSLDDCQGFSEIIGQELDKTDFIGERYILEVSSPGIDRALKKPRDFLRERGKMIDVTLYAPRNGKKNLTGVLSDYDGENLTLDDDAVPVKDIAAVRLHIDI